MKDSLFEKDFGIYSEFIQDTKKFLNALIKVDKIGNLTKQAVKKELLRYIYSTASKKTQNKKKINAIRDDIFDLLLEHGYIVENHPRTAGGNEDLRTSYKVGKKYQIALDDEFRHKRETVNVEIEHIQVNGDGGSNLIDAFNGSYNGDSLNEEEFREILVEQIGELNYYLFTMHRLNEKRDFEKSLNVGRDLIRKFFIELFDSCIKKSKDLKLRFKDINEFLIDLLKNNRIPFKATDLQIYLRENQTILSDISANFEANALRLCDLVSDFYKRLYNHINQNQII